MREIILLSIGAVSAVFILGYSIHMLIGGLVAPATERWIIGIACAIGVGVIIALGIDIVRQRRRR